MNPDDSTGERRGVSSTGERRGVSRSSGGLRRPQSISAAKMAGSLEQARQIGDSGAVRRAGPRDSGYPRHPWGLSNRRLQRIEKHACNVETGLLHDFLKAGRTGHIDLGQARPDNIESDEQQAS
jgi:hypothetical protein